MITQNTFWLDDIRVLIDKGSLFNIIPIYSTSINEKLNAITRFCIYLIILLLVTNTSTTYVYIALFMIIATVIVYLIYKHRGMDSSTNKNRRIDKPYVTNVENMEDIEIVDPRTLDSDSSDSKSDDMTNETKTLSFFGENNNHLVRGSKIKKFTDKRFSTKDNPFMNPTINDISKPPEPQVVAMNADDEDIQDVIMDNFNKDIYKNWSDIYDRKTNERQFYRISTKDNIPDTVAFARWAYGTGSTCKEDYGKCYVANPRYQDNMYF